MKPVHLKIVQGTPFRLLVRVARPDDSPVDLTGAIVKLQARVNVTSDETLLDLSRDRGLDIDDTGGTITVDLSGDDTARLDWGDVTRAKFECLVSPADGDPFRILEGMISLDRAVVR